MILSIHTVWQLNSRDLELANRLPSLREGICLPRSDLLLINSRYCSKSIFIPL